MGKARFCLTLTNHFVIRYPPPFSGNAYAEYALLVIARYAYLVIAQREYLAIAKREYLAIAKTA